jgi:hypothetical protein
MEGIAAASALDYVKPERISLKKHPGLDEKWVQALLAKDPSILGLGDDLVSVGKEVTLPGGGRLDLLFANNDEDEPAWYEVEVQLGATDPSHISRTIEYWDLERTRYPDRKHVAVLVAEDITSRFLNVISLLNRSVPIIAIQMQAIQVGTQLTLVFTTVVDLASRRDDDADAAIEAANRQYWEKKAKTALPIVDTVFAYVQEIESGFALGYNLDYIQINRGGRNLISFTPRKADTRIKVKMSKTADSEDLKAEIENAGIKVRYDEAAKGGACYRLFMDYEKFEGVSSSVRKLISLAVKGIE